MTNKIYFIANWKMYGHRTSANSIKNVIRLAKSKKYKHLKLINSDQKYGGIISQNKKLATKNQSIIAQNKALLSTS